MERDDGYWEGMSRCVERGEYTPVGPVELGPAAAEAVSVPWPIVTVESRGGTWVRVQHIDSTLADHDLSYLIGAGGVFDALTVEVIPTVALVDGGTIGWMFPDGSVLDLAPDALHEHAATGRCPGGTCTGWTLAHTVVIRRPER